MGLWKHESCSSQRRQQQAVWQERDRIQAEALSNGRLIVPSIRSQLARTKSNVSKLVAV